MLISKCHNFHCYLELLFKGIWIAMIPTLTKKVVLKSIEIATMPTLTKEVVRKGNEVAAMAQSQL